MQAMPHTTHAHTCNYHQEGPPTGPHAHRSVTTAGGRMRAHDGSSGFLPPRFDQGQVSTKPIMFLEQTNREYILA